MNKILNFLTENRVRMYENVSRDKAIMYKKVIKNQVRSEKNWNRFEQSEKIAFLRSEKNWKPSLTAL